MERLSSSPVEAKALDLPARAALRARELEWRLHHAVKKISIEHGRHWVQKVSKSLLPSRIFQKQRMLNPPLPQWNGCWVPSTFSSIASVQPIATKSMLTTPRRGS